MSISIQEQDDRSTSTGAAYALLLLLLLMSIVSCAPTIPHGAQRIDSDVFVEKLDEGLWRHVSHRFLPAAGQVPSNGLVVAVPDGALVIDTAWTNEQTAGLLEWTEANVGPVVALIITHAHDDRMGGIEEIHRRGIPSYGLERTSAISKSKGEPALTNTFALQMPLDEFGLVGEIFYPGPGHTVDNVVVWLKDFQTLFGSCMVRAADWGIGNLEDAAPKDWGQSAKVLVGRYPGARTVVPGHGDPGDIELLLRTQKLVDEIQ